MQNLVAVRREIRHRVKQRWWQSGEINRDRWRVLEDLVNLGIQEAKEYLERALVIEIQEPPERILGDRNDLRRFYTQLRRRIWNHLHNGELDVEQQGRLFELIAAAVAEEPSWPSRERVL